MDLRTVVTFSTLLLAVAEQTSAETNNTHPSPSTTKNGSTSRSYSSGPVTPPSTASPASNPVSPPPAPGRLTVNWKGKCEGADIVILHHPSSTTSAVCHGSAKSIESLQRIVCENQGGCDDKRHGDKGPDLSDGSDGTVKRTGCETVKVQCAVDEVLQDVQRQLQAYKVVTAVLCCVLLVLLLIRFTRPTVKVLQKRLSDRRQNRWIGPTQSHSVSYHRGKTAVRNNDADSRLSYPALERLAVFDSGEPSSNRSSGYNF
ncbi:CD5 molecule [Gasterosteus aculeatus]